MSAILTVFRKEVRENLRDRRTVFSSLIFGTVVTPLLMAVLLKVVLQHVAPSADRAVELAVMHAERAPNLLAFLRQSNLELVAVDYDDAAARAAVRGQVHHVVLAIPADYGPRLSSAQPAPLQLYLDSSDTADERDVNRVRLLLAQYNGRIVQARQLARGVDPLSMQAVAVQDVDVSTPSARAVVALGSLSYLILLTMLMGGLYLAIDTTAGERERGSLEPLITLPVRRDHLIYGKMLATCAFMTLSLTLSVLALSVVLRRVGLENVGLRINFGLPTALGIIAGCLPLVPLGAALMTIVAAFTRNYREAQTYTSLVMLVPTLPLMFAGILGMRPTAALMLVPSLSQHFLIMSQLRAEPLPLSYVALSAGTTLLIGAVLGFIAGGLYKREALLG